MEPIWNERVLKHDDLLVIADLHIGYERELEDKGINIPPQSQKMIDRVSRLLEKENADKLIINGDFKHNIPRATWQEYEDIPKAVDEWLKIIDEIHLIPGNHDGGIQEYLPSEVVMHASSGALIDGVGFFHGHAVPEDEIIAAGNLVIGHSHPAVTLRDSLGNREKDECWVKLNYAHDISDGSAVVMPHMNHLLGGVSVNEDGYLGPFLNNTELFEEDIYLLDGTHLGRRESIVERHSP